MGRPKVNIDWEQVGQMLEADCTAEGIAATFGICRDILYKRCETDNKISFSTFSQQKKAKGDELLRVKQFSSAMQGNISMLIWLGKQRLGQSDKQDFNHGGNLNLVHSGEIAFQEAAKKIYGKKEND